MTLTIPLGAPPFKDKRVTPISQIPTAGRASSSIHGGCFSTRVIYVRIFVLPFFNTQKRAVKNEYHFHRPFPRKKLPIRPMLMRGRAQAFCLDESARGSRRSGMSVSSRKSRYSLIATRMSSRSSSGVLMEFSARRRGEIHEGSVPFFPASMDCAPRGLERPSPGLFASLIT